MKILKRNNKVATFEQAKIENAILKAMKYGSGVYNKDLAKAISEEITEECRIANKIVGMVTVRNVEDMTSMFQMTGQSRPSSQMVELNLIQSLLIQV